MGPWGAGGAHPRRAPGPRGGLGDGAGRAPARRGDGRCVDHPDTAGIGEHLPGRAREILAAELGRAYLRGLESFNPAAVAQQVVRRVVAAGVQTIRTELMRACDATVRALLDAAGRWRRWDTQLDTACTPCASLDGRIAEPGQPFAARESGRDIAARPKHYSG